MSKEIKDSDMTQPAEQQEKKVPLLNKWLLLFMAAMILANIGGNMYGSLLPLYQQRAI